MGVSTLQKRLAVSKIGCPPSTVKVYDSLYSEFPTQTKEQICALLASQEPVIELIYVTVQSQQNAWMIVGFLRWPMQLFFVEGRILNLPTPQTFINDSYLCTT